MNDKRSGNKKNKRGVSNLDMYIDLILKNAVSLDEFLYLIRNSDDDPYDLEITDYGKIKGQLEGNKIDKKDDKT